MYETKHSSPSPNPNKMNRGRLPVALLAGLAIGAGGTSIIEHGDTTREKPVTHTVTEIVSTHSHLNEGNPGGPVLPENPSHPTIIPPPPASK
jgi:hypothetical protein